MSKQKITRADLVKEDQVNIKFATAISKRGGDEDHVIEKDHNEKVFMRPHNDLLNAFSKFIPHLMFKIGLYEIDCFRPEWFDNFEYLDDPRFEGVHVTGVMFVGKDQEAIKIIGKKVNENGDSTSLVSPIIRLGEAFEDQYALGNLITTHVATWLKEVKNFVNGKYATEYQLKMDLKVAS